MAVRDLACPHGCGSRFEALNAPLFVDRTGRYLEHDDARATFVCAVCGSVAIDVAVAAREMRRRGEAPQQTITCPACGTEMLPPEDDPLADLLECPVCGQRFTLDEGTPSIGGGRGRGDEGPLLDGAGAPF